MGQAQTVQAYFRELVVTDLAPHVHRLRARTLLLWGACDMLFSEAARRYTVRGVTAERRVISSHCSVRDGDHDEPPVALTRLQVDALPAETTRVKEYALGSHFVHAEKQHVDTVVADIVAFFADRA